MSSTRKRFQPRRTEIVIAIIGLLGVLTTALFSNWDKLFSKQNTLRAEYSGYRPTGNFETEFRYYFEVSRTREMLETLLQEGIQHDRNRLLAGRPNDAEQINRIFDDLAKEIPKAEDIIKLYLPIYQKHLTVSEIQELNKFYSTDLMQRMVQKMPLVIQDTMPIQAKLVDDLQKRSVELMKRELLREDKPLPLNDPTPRG